MTIGVTQPGAPTIGVALDSGARRLAAAGIESPRLDARVLLASAAECRLEQLVARPEHALDAAAAAAFEALVLRRERREPVAQILGCKEFWSLPFIVTRDTLTPRPDSETVIEAALALRPDRSMPLRILDLGTGTGCLLLALLSEYPEAYAVGTDISDAALRVAAANAAALGLSGRAGFVRADWDIGIGGRFDLVVSNPPYIADGAIARLEPEVRDYEPHAALSGGIDGLESYRTLSRRLKSRLAPGGCALLEIGDGQANVVETLLRTAGLSPSRRFTDLGGIARCLAAEGGP